MDEPLQGLFSSSKLLTLDFSEIPQTTPGDESIENFFKKSIKDNINPRLPRNRQKFNDYVSAKSSFKYLIGRYCEDRASMLSDTQIGREGRTIHLGVDIFSKDLEQIYAPCDGEILRRGYEKGFGSFGYYLIFKPDKIPGIYLFFGHLSKDLPKKGRALQGVAIGRLGDYANNENGGWSRHLHLQTLKELPPSGETPIGYSTKADLPVNMERFPDPIQYFPEWQAD